MKHLISIIKVVFLTALLGLIAGCSNEPKDGVDKEIYEHGHSHD